MEGNTLNLSRSLIFQLSSKDVEEAKRLYKNPTEFKRFLKRKRYIPAYLRILNYELKERNGKAFCKVVVEA